MVTNSILFTLACLALSAVLGVVGWALVSIIDSVFGPFGKKNEKTKQKPD